MTFLIDKPSPNRVLSVEVIHSEGLDSWPYDDGNGDPWWEGGDSPVPYQWLLNVNVFRQDHGSHLTREPYTYNGLDIKVGDWVASTSNGRCVMIVSITEKTENSVSMIVEDVDRYNTFQDPLGDGSVGTSQCVVFQVNDNALPILDPKPTTVTSLDFITSVNSRFQTANPLQRHRVVQTAHGLNDNDAIWVNPANGNFEKVDDQSVKDMVGVVAHLLNEDVFYFRPISKIVIGIFPILPGSAGSLIYVNSDGTLTANETPNGKVAYIQLTDPRPDVIVGSNANPVVVASDLFKINGVEVTTTNTTLTSVVSDINILTSQHGVSATEVTAESTATTVSSDRIYGMVGAQGSVCSAVINGITVTFDITVSGTQSFGVEVADSVDMAESINNASIPDITANGGSGGPSGVLTISNSNGDAITIVNVTNDTAGTPFAGTSSASGVPLSTPQSTDVHIRLENTSGFGIILSESSNSILSLLGIHSVQNGMVPEALAVEQSIRKGEISVVPDISSRDALFPIVGDMAYVLDSADMMGNKSDEWSVWLWDNSQWVRISDKDSATTDAHTISISLTHTDSGNSLVGTLSDKSRITLLTVEVTQAFDDITASLDIRGDNGIVTDIMINDYLDLGTTGTYSMPSSLIFDGGNDIEVVATLVSGSSITGSVVITASYQ